MELQINMTEIIVGGISFLGIIISSIFSFLGHRNARQANRAVNGVGPDKPRIYDMISSNQTNIKNIESRQKQIESRQKELIDWKNTYKDSPWATGAGVDKWIKEYEATAATIVGRRTSTDSQDADHI